LGLDQKGNSLRIRHLGNWRLNRQYYLLIL
jgi:hypothetical protein